MKQMASGIARVKLSTYMVPSRPRTLRKTTVALTGTLTGINALLTSNSVAGQVITLTGDIANNFTGTYKINGAVPTAIKATSPVSNYLASPEPGDPVSRLMKNTITGSQR